MLDLSQIEKEWFPGGTIPMELLEFDMSWEEHRGTRTDKTNDQEDHSTLKPEEVEDKAIDIGQQTKVPNGDYKLSTESYNALKL